MDSQTEKCPVYESLESRVVYKTPRDPITHVMRKQAVTILKSSLPHLG